MTITFRPQVGTEAFSCTATYTGFGTTGSTVAFADFKLYLSDVRLVTSSGSEEPVTLEQDGEWQLQNVALLDFDNGTGSCVGSTETNYQVKGTVPAGTYSGIKFTMGIPFDLNHGDVATAAAPLNSTDMFWVWNYGYKFLRVDLSTTGQPDGFFLHVGSTGCNEAHGDIAAHVLHRAQRGGGHPDRLQRRERRRGGGPEAGAGDHGRRRGRRRRTGLHVEPHRSRVRDDLPALGPGVWRDAGWRAAAVPGRGAVKLRVILVAAAVLTGCGGENTEPSGDTFAWRLPARFPEPLVPDSNPMTNAKVDLGRHLFYDQRMAVTQQFSCASCHEQSRAFTDGREVAVGATGQPHPRNSLTLANVAYPSSLNWANPLVRRHEMQALIPMFGDNPVELGLTGEEQALLERFRTDRTYQALFPAAFPAEADPFSIDAITKALAAFQRTIISGQCTLRPVPQW